MKRAVVFGLGNRWNKFKDIISNEWNIVALLDNDSKKQGMIYEGIPSFHPCMISNIDFDYVLITVEGNDAAEISDQLRSYGVNEDHIIIYDKQISQFLIDPLFFSESLSTLEKRTLFKNNVELVFLELNSSCNRRCWMCPNSIIDRHSSNTKLSHDILIKVLKELQEIDYDCDISLSAFNEPMLDEDLDDNIILIKSYLPNAPLHFNTNGDYLSRKRLEELEVLGLDFLPVSIYIDTIDKVWNYQDSIIAIEKAVKKLDLSINAITEANNVNTTCICYYKSLPVIFRCANHRVVASDRGGSLPEEAPVLRNVKANRICDRFFTQFTVNYDGSVTHCSNFHPDFIPHSRYKEFGINDNSIFDIFTSEKWTNSRKLHIGDMSKLPCNTCGIISDIWGDTSLSIMSFQPFRDRPRYRSNKR
ncbi:MAG: SPASM domain-containing protein [Oscillospiraceae bacterium]|nr:SPASM domain-containing protein [Oscillospiraceae bacterium]